MEMLVNSRLKKELAKGFQEHVIPALRDQGFDDFRDCLAWRTTSTNIDVVGIVIENSSTITRYLPEKSIGYYLEAGTYYRAVELLPWVELPVKRSTFPKSQKGSPTDCHRRLVLGQSTPVAPSLPSTLQVVGTDIRKGLEEARSALLSRALPWLESTHDVDYILDMYEASVPEFSPGWNRSPELALFDREQSYATPYGDLLLGLLLSRGNYEQVIRLMEDSLEIYCHGGPTEPNGRKWITSHMKQMALLYPARIASIQALRDA